jgi:tetratricopeptide (TPR) repeat protein
VEIFNANENEILDLYDRSLLKLVESDESYGKVEDPEYWLYNFHAAVKGYVEDITSKNNQSYHDLELEYGEKFSEYYSNLLSDTYNSIGKENHRSSFARFNIIYQGGDNDFESAIKLTTNRQLRAVILRHLGLVVYQLGMLSKALDYLKKAQEIDEGLNDRVGMARDYANIGVVLQNIGNNNEALDYLKKAQEIHEGLNDRVGMARDYANIGNVLKNIGNNNEALDYLKKAQEINEGSSNMQLMYLTNIQKVGYL